MLYFFFSIIVWNVNLTGPQKRQEQAPQQGPQQATEWTSAKSFVDTTSWHDSEGHSSDIMKCTQPHSPLTLPQSHCSIHLCQSSTFTLQHSRHSIHAALKQQHSRCTYAAAFTPQQPLCCSTHTSDTTALPVFCSSHAAALMQQLSRCHIYAAAFTQQCSIHAEACTQQHSCFTYATTLTLMDEDYLGLTMPLHNLAMQAGGS